MFVKNDSAFICMHCCKKVEKLEYTSRDHCPYCLYSLHVDIEPGDRLNDCKGLLKPINFVTNNNKSQIEYVCTKCGKKVKNVVAKDDDKDEIFKIIESYAKRWRNVKNGKCKKKCSKENIRIARYAI